MNAENGSRLQEGQIVVGLLEDRDGDLPGGDLPGRGDKSTDDKSTGVNPDDNNTARVATRGARRLSLWEQMALGETALAENRGHYGG